MQHMAKCAVYRGAALAYFTQTYRTLTTTIQKINFIQFPTYKDHFHTAL